MASSTQIPKWIDRSLAYPWLLLVLAMGLIAASASFLPKLSKDTSADAFIDPNSSALIYKDKVEQLFSLTDPIVIAVIDHDGIFNAENLALLKQLSDGVKQLKYVDPDRVTSLATENNISGTAEGLIVEGFLDSDTEHFKASANSEQRAAEIRTAIEDFPLYQGSLVGKAGTATLIVAEILNEDEAQLAYDAVVELVNNTPKPKGTAVHIAGEGAVAGFLSTYIDRDASRLNPMAGLIITIVLLIGFVSLRATLLPNIIVAGTVLGSFGLMAASGTSFYVITNGLVVNLIGISVADSIHILSAYYGIQRAQPSIDKKQAVKLAVAGMWRPVSLTSITTITGFLALSASATMPPVQAFGLYGALGVALAWLYSLTLLPALMILWPSSRIPLPFRKNKHHSDKPKAVERLLNGFGKAVLHRPKITIAIGAFAFAIGIIGAAQVKVDEDRIENFQKSEPVYIADKAINAATDGIYNLDILVETNSNGGLYSPATLHKIADLQQYVESLYSVGGSTSIVDYIKQLHRSVNEGNKDFYSIPDDPNLIAQLFFLYGASADPTDFEEEIDYDHRQALIRVQVKEGKYSNNKILIPSIEKYIEEQFNSPEIQATVTGRVAVNYHWIKGIDQSTLFSIIISFICVTATAMLVFKSISAGLLAATPVGLAILLVYAVMGFSGIPLGVSTSMFAAIAIGLSIDFAIHTLDKLREIGREYGLSAESLMAFYPDTGRALLLNFIAVAGGFGVLMSSEVPPLVKFGGLVAVAVSVAFLSSLSLLPSLALWLQPKALLSDNSSTEEHQAEGDSYEAQYK